MLILLNLMTLGTLTVISDIESRTLYDILLGCDQKILANSLVELRNPQNVQWILSDIPIPEKIINNSLPNAQWTTDYKICPAAIAFGYAECVNRLIRENNLSGRGYSFEVLRARSLYRNTNFFAILENDLIGVGPIIPSNQPVFRFENID